MESWHYNGVDIHWRWVRKSWHIRDEFLALWEEFEAKETAEAKFAGVIDRLEPLLQNYYDNGHTWKKHHVPAEKVFALNRKIENGSTALWEYAKSLIEESVEKGYLKGTG